MKTGIQIAFGKAVKKARKRRGWSQEMLAEKTKLHRTYIGSVERGERNISLENIVAIADALEQKPSIFMKTAGF